MRTREACFGANSTETLRSKKCAFREDGHHAHHTFRPVRASDNRYRDDLRRLHLAHRLIRLEARTSTIRRWTGLSPFSVRTLHQAYCDGRYGPRLTRHRGVPPYIVKFFWSSPEVHCESALLAGLCRLFGALPPQPIQHGRENLPTLVRGEQLCEAFESFKTFVPASAITIDHAVLLLTALAEGDEVILVRCTVCSGLTCVDRLSLSDRVCSCCRTDDGSAQPGSVKLTRRAKTGKPWRHSVRP